MDLQRVERELKKRLIYPYRWGRKQSNSWDNDTNFIYQTYSFESLLRKTKHFSQALQNYALNRWYNFWSAMAAEDIFTSHTNVIAHKNAYDKLVDFTIETIPFDHKTSIFPKGFQRSYEYAIKNEKELIQWLYENQSQQSRKHLENRLFVIMYDKKNQHWKMKAEILHLKTKIDQYVDSFSIENLHQFDFGNGTVYSDIVWVTQ